MAAPTSLRIPIKFDPAFDPRRTEFLSRMVEKWSHFEGVLTNGNGHHIYGYTSMSDRRMAPLLRPGSIVLVDASVHKIDDGVGRPSMTGRCTSWSCAMDIVAGGSIRKVRGW